jgi:uncharacterized membrane protein YgaE (UPF0421/DUF939 family)
MLCYLKNAVAACRNIEQQLRCCAIYMKKVLGRRLPQLSKNQLSQIIKQLHVGMRIIKSAIAVYLSITISLAIDGQPTSAAVAAFMCTRSSNEATVDMGKNRTIGTMIGATYSLLFILVVKCFNVEFFSHGYYIMVSLLLIPVIKTTLWLKIADATVVAYVVVLLTLLNYVRDGDPYLRILYRLVDTAIGVIIAIIVNKLLPRKKAEKGEIKTQ